jgi:hypothetical protein
MMLDLMNASTTCVLTVDPPIHEVPAPRPRPASTSEAQNEFNSGRFRSMPQGSDHRVEGFVCAVRVQPFGSSRSGPAVRVQPFVQPVRAPSKESSGEWRVAVPGDEVGESLSGEVAESFDFVGVVFP